MYSWGGTLTPVRAAYNRPRGGRELTHPGSKSTSFSKLPTPVSSFIPSNLEFDSSFVIRISSFPPLFGRRPQFILHLMEVGKARIEVFDVLLNLGGVGVGIVQGVAQRASGIA